MRILKVCTRSCEISYINDVKHFWVTVLCLALLFVCSCPKNPTKSGSNTSVNGVPNSNQVVNGSPSNLDSVKFPDGFPLPNLVFPGGTERAELHKPFNSKGDGFTADMPSSGGETLWLIGFKNSNPVNTVMDQIETELVNLGFVTSSKEKLSKEPVRLLGTYSSSILECERENDGIRIQVLYSELRSAVLGSSGSYQLYCFTK